MSTLYFPPPYFSYSVYGTPSGSVGTDPTNNWMLNILKNVGTELGQLLGTDAIRILAAGDFSDMVQPDEPVHIEIYPKGVRTLSHYPSEKMVVNMKIRIRIDSVSWGDDPIADAFESVSLITRALSGNSFGDSCIGDRTCVTECQLTEIDEGRSRVICTLETQSVH